MRATAPILTPAASTAAAAQTTAGLQKWVFDGSQWMLAYTLQAGLDLGQPYTVRGYPTGDSAATGLPWAPATDGLRNITGQLNRNGTVTIWAVTSTVSGGGDQGADPNKLVEITDPLTAGSPASAESFRTVPRPASARSCARLVHPGHQELAAAGTMDGMGQGSQSSQDLNRKLGREEASDAVTGLGWRLVLGDLRTEVLTGSLPLAADVAGRAAALPHAEGHLRMDIRQDRVLLTLQTAAADWVTPRDVELARQITALAEEFRLTTRSGADEDGAGPAVRPVQVLEIAIDVIDGAKVRPFWQAVLGYVDQPGTSGPLAGLIDPLGQGPAFWFQQMDEPRPQRNRVHFDVSVPHDQAHQRLQDTIAAGGTLVSDAEAPAFWILADPEGNEVCVCTWQGRDPGSVRGPEPD